MYCTKCGKEATSGDLFCAKCGAALASNQAHLDSESQYERAVPYLPSQLKSEETSVLLAFFLGLFFILGVAHIYLGRFKKGAMLFLAGVLCYGVSVAGMVLYHASAPEQCFGYGICLKPHNDNYLTMPLVFGIGYLGIWIWQILDARKICRDYNSRIVKSNQNPDI
jgi:hypothetical protein